MQGSSATNSDSMLQTHGESDPLLSQTLKEPDSGDHQCNLCSRNVRKGLFVGCLAVAFIHWRVSNCLNSLLASVSITSACHAFIERTI